MSFAQEQRDIHEKPWIAIGLCGLGGFILLISIILITITLAKPPEKPLTRPYVPLIVGGLMLVAGIYLFKHARVGLRLKPNEIELRRFKVAIPWQEIVDIGVVFVPVDQPTHQVPLLVMSLTPSGREAIGNRFLTNSNFAKLVEPKPDICLKMSFLSYGPGIESPLDFAIDLRKRKGAAAGIIDETPPLPPIDAAFELRATSETGSASRVYVHETCGSNTIISGSALNWVTNPMRYTSGACKCAQCGSAFDFELRWLDTGETLSRFRSRMWRQTPFGLKLLQFVVLPAVIGILVAIMAPFVFRPAHNLPPLVDGLLTFGAGFVLGNLVIWLTPLAGIIPGRAGLTYNKYR